MQPVIDISRQHSWQSTGEPALVGDYTQYMQQPGQHQQIAGSTAGSAPWQTVGYPSHPPQTAFSIAAADEIAHLAPCNTSALASQQQQQQQQLGQDTVAPEVPSATNFPGPDAAVTCNNSSPEMSGTSGANEAGIAPADSMPEGLQDGGDPSSSKPHLPVVHLKVACGDQVGTLLVHKAKIVMFEGTPNEKEVSPTEFERLGGRSATKKWKQSIRLTDADGDQGRPVGEWYIQQGLEQPKKPRDIKDTASTSTAPPGSASPNNHDTRYSATAAAQAAAAVPTGPNKRPVRSTRGHVPAKHAPTAAEGSPGGRSSRRGHGPRATPAAAAAASGRAHLWDDSGSGTTDSPDDPVAAAAAAQDIPWMPDDQLQQQYMIQQMQPQIMLPDQHVQQQQQQQQQGYGGVMSPTDSTAAAMADEAAALRLDYAALGDWQLPPAAAAAVPQGILVQVPVSGHLPGDASEAVVEMSAYLEGCRRIPPWRLLPPAQRPVVGKFLVPLRRLFVLVLQAGGHSVIKDDLLIWQDFAAQLGLPAWPCPDAPDPLRALQQVYRDYLLRFEGRFTLQSGVVGGGVDPSAGPAAAAGVQGLIQQSPSLSATTQFAPEGAVMQLPQGLPATGGVPLSSGTTYVPVGGGMLDTTTLNTFNSALMPVLGSSLPQQQQQLLQPQVNNALPAGLAAEILLDDNLSGDLLDFLTDLIPDSDSSAAAPPQQQHVGQLPAPAAAAAPAGPVDTAGGRLQGGHAATAAAAAPAPAATAIMRQHPEMTYVQQRQRLQHLQQHLQYLQQQQHQPSSDGLTPAAAVQPGSAAAGAAVAHGGVALAAGRSKRPAPLIRCGDSDLISLMDQSEVTRLLQDYEQQQQRHQLTAVCSRQQQQLPLLPGLAPQQHHHPSSSQLAAAVAGAVDRNMSQDLHAMMQQYWNQQQQQQQQQQVAVVQQQGEQQYDDELHTQTADEEVSGMLGSLQLAGDAAGGQQQQQGDLLLLSPNNSGSGWSNKLLGQMSLGARLVGDLMAVTAAGSSSSGHIQTMHTSGDHTEAAAWTPQIAWPISQPSSYPMLPPAPRNHPQQQHQHGPEDLCPSGTKEGQGLGQGLLRLTTPNSAMFASVLDSPTLRTSGPSAAGWMDMSGLLSNTGNLKSMTVELTGVDGPQGEGGQGLQGDDLSAVLRMW